MWPGAPQRAAGRGSAAGCRCPPRWVHVDPVPPPADQPGPPRRRVRELLSVFQYSGRAIGLVWSTSRLLTVLLIGLSLAAGLLPALIAYVGKWLVDAVVEAAARRRAAAGWEAAAGAAGPGPAIAFVALEAGLVASLAAAQRAISTCQSLLRAQLGHRVNVMILEKALTLELRHFEDSEFYDKL